MWLMICEQGDYSALWMRGQLESRGLQPFELITGDKIAPSQRWELRVGDGGSSATVDLTSAHQIRSDQILGVINRLRYSPSRNFLARGSALDWGYASQELAAFFLGFLASLPDPVMNRPTACGFSGRERDPLEWTVLAARAGIESPTRRQSTRQRVSEPTLPFPEGASSTSCRVVVVAFRHVVGHDVPLEIREACRKLAILSMTALLGISLRTDGSRWVFDGATIWPDLASVGYELVEVIADVLRIGSVR